MLRTEGRLKRADERRNATVLTLEFLTWEDDRLLATTLFESYYPDVRLEHRLEGQGVPRGTFTSAAPDSSLLPVGEPILVDRSNAVIYSECSRIWNPIHTDPRVARGAGLDMPLLHGTEVLGRTISQLQQSTLIPNGATVVSVSVRFTRPVFPGAKLLVNGASIGPNQVLFDVVDASDGGRPLSDGQLAFAT